jgi:hypothetical protein
VVKDSVVLTDHTDRDNPEVFAEDHSTKELEPTTGLVGYVRVQVDAKLSKSFQSLGIALEIQYPVVDPTPEKCVERINALKETLDERLATFVEEIRETLPQLK